MATGEEAIPEFDYDIDFNDVIIEKEIGRGGFGKVYKGQYFGIEVAIKQIQEAQTPEEVLFIKREVAILKGIRHPSCVQFIGVTTDTQGCLNIVMEFVSGGNLRGLLKDHSKPLSWHWRCGISSDIAGAMAYLHSKNILFRDLKSKNILLEGNKAKICDFGLARAHTGQTNRPMTICGTDEWMAPEVILGMDYNNSADVFSYGIVLLEIVTRAKISLELQRSPMDAFGISEDQARQLIPAECPPAFSQLCFDCTAYEPDRRPIFKNVVIYLNRLLKEIPRETAAPVAPTAPKAGPKTSGFSSTAPKPVTTSIPKTYNSTPSTTTPKPVTTSAPKTFNSTAPKPVTTSIPKTYNSTPSTTTPKPVTTSAPKTFNSTAPKPVTTSIPKTYNSTPSTTTPKPVTTSAPKTYNSGPKPVTTSTPKSFNTPTTTTSVGSSSTTTAPKPAAKKASVWPPPKNY
eukprot:TRINITY_DN1114_c0_g1_i2.p1 TRINITY_DN1114_c0_g1~~TRINITY_DN1114_c0_g1_i2.p1  ORF type:complete len:457 (+),score=241.05 TRINITY_DN1114_c0_g1_i2:104-1474(+)